MDERLLTPARRRRALPDQRQDGAARDPPRAAARDRLGEHGAYRHARAPTSTRGSRRASWRRRPAGPTRRVARAAPRAADPRRAGSRSRRTWAARRDGRGRLERKGSISARCALWLGRDPDEEGHDGEARAHGVATAARYSVWRVRWYDETRRRAQQDVRPRGRRAARSRPRSGRSSARARSPTSTPAARRSPSSSRSGGASTPGPNLERATLRAYASLWNGHALPRLGQLQLRELTPQTIARFRADLEAAGVGDRGDPQDDDDAPGRAAARGRVGPRADQRGEDHAQAAEAAIGRRSRRSRRR